MTTDDPRFEAACQNLATFIWGNWDRFGYSNKEDFWNAVPETTKVQIREFILSPKENPKRKQ